MMTSNSQNDLQDQELDNRLADFADQVMNGMIGQIPFEAEKEAQESEKAEIAELKKTILRFHAAVKAAQPDPATAARIASRVKIGSKKPVQAWWKSWLGTFQPGFKPQAALAVAMVVVVLVAASLIKPGAGELAGTAIGFPTWALVLFIGIVVIVIIVIFKKNGL
jgi:anti-sigma-K factor RskA